MSVMKKGRGECEDELREPQSDHSITSGCIRGRLLSESDSRNLKVKEVHTKQYAKHRVVKAHVP